MDPSDPSTPSRPAEGDGSASTGPTSPGEPNRFEHAARRREAFRRFFLAHLFTYVPTFVWAVAWIPIVIEAHFDTLSMESDPSRVSDFVLREMIAPALVAFVVPHLFAIPWVLAEEKTRGRTLAFAGTAAVALVGLVVGVVTWWRLLTI